MQVPDDARHGRRAREFAPETHCERGRPVPRERLLADRRGGRGAEERVINHVDRDVVANCGRGRAGKAAQRHRDDGHGVPELLVRGLRVDETREDDEGERVHGGRQRRFVVAGKLDEARGLLGRVLQEADSGDPCWCLPHSVTGPRFCFLAVDERELGLEKLA